MTKKIYYLSTCSTCKRIIEETGITAQDITFQDIKTEKISAAQLNEMKELSGSYESLFSRRSLQYKALGLKDKELKENDFRDYILQEYTFLKRPVVIIDKEIYIGNDKKTIAALKDAVAQS